MTTVFNASSSTTGSTPTSYSGTFSYSTIYASSTTYKINVTESSSGYNATYTVWVQTDGTVSAVNVDGQNITGSEAQELTVGVFAAFTLQIQADAAIGQYTTTSYFHVTGTSTQSIGPTQVKVTSYSANNLPETETGCDGVTTTITAFGFSVGTPSGASLPLVTYEHISDSSTSDGQTTTSEVYLQVTSITLAS